MMKHKISVITVVYNGVKTIEQTIRSVLGQTYENIEYIIIDGKSTDGTIDIIDKYKDKLSYYISESDRGIYDAMNKGIAAATGEVIGLLNADDWYDRNALTYVMRCFWENDTDIVYGQVCRVEPDETISDVKKPGSPNGLWYYMTVWHPAAFVKREIYQRLGGFSTDYEIAGDYEFILRCYCNRLKFTYLDRMLTYFRSAGISNVKYMKCARECNEIALKYMEQAPDRQRVIDENGYRIREAIFKERYDTDFQMLLYRLPWNEDEKIIVWGTGVWGRKIVSLFIESGRQIEFLIDSDAQKEGKNLLGIKIKRPDALKESHANVLVAVRRVNRDIQKQLLQFGIARKQYLFLEEWMISVAESEKQRIQG